MSDTKTTHTPGPLAAEYSKVIDSHFGLVIAECNTGSLEERKAWARLLAASAESYRKHCGPRAVECAEADLLGELLKALQDLVDSVGERAPDMSPGWGRVLADIFEARAVIAKATREKS